MALFVLCCGSFAFGCGRQADGPTQPGEGAADETQEIVGNLVEAGFPADDIMVSDGVVYVGRDAAVSLQASREMLAAGDAGGEEQYRTSNLVGGNITTICVVPQSFSGTISQGLDLAIENYNEQNLSFRMERRTGGNTAGCGATITGRVAGPAGGQSGFPSGGRPFSSFQIGSGTANFGVNVVAHVITHELGHAVGFRHSDFFNRSISCGGSAVNEGQADVGAILIPGTPSGATVGGSLMNSCFRSNEAGNFTSPDVTALQALYGD